MGELACEWGEAGIAAWRDRAAVFIIVDVLSFSTAVSVAVERGAHVIPFPYGDAAAAAAEAARQGAVAAVPRSAGGGQLSLSPVSLRAVAPGTRLLLPSPNGSRLSLTTGEVPTLCGALRNARAVAAAAAGLAGGGRIVVIAAGERWPDGTLRPAIEDWLGAGAVLAALDGMPTAEAELARDSYRGAGPRLAELVRTSRSGRELIDAGYPDDVEIALRQNADAPAALLRSGAYEAV